MHTNTVPAQLQENPALLADEAVRSPGIPLPTDIQREAALRYGQSFSGVRLHTDAPAHDAAALLHASAFTLGDDIAFGVNRYAPETPQGYMLLQHELRHVAQQRPAAPAKSPRLDSPNSHHERDAYQILDPHVETLPVQRIQCAPEDAQFSLGEGMVDTVGHKAFGDPAWPFIKAVLEGFVGGLKEDVKAGRADSAKSNLAKLLVPWNAAKFYVGYLVGLVIGLVSPITDLVKGVIGIVKIGISALEWLAKWSPAGIAISPERQQKIVNLMQKFNDLTVEFGKALMDFIADPKGTIRKFSGFLDNLMQMTLGKAREIGAKGAHSIFDFLGSDNYYEMGKGIGEVIGVLIAQVLMLVFSEAIANVIAEGASLFGKAAEFLAGKAVQVFEWVKGFVSKVVSLLQDAVKGAMKMFEGLVNKAIEAFGALKALFTEAASIELSAEKAVAGIGRGISPPLSNVMESRMVKPPPRTSPATVADLKPAKIHPSNVPKEVSKPSGGSSSAGSGKRPEPFANDPDFHKSIKELEDVPGAQSEPLQDPSNVWTRKQAGVSLEEDHHIATRYLEKNKAIFENAGTHIDADLNLIKEFPEHGQLRGWYEWKSRSYKFHMKGHHPEYNRWVTKHLTDATPIGLTPDQALDRIILVNQRLESIIRQHPEVLSHGPDILPPELRNLIFDWN